jgi:hypothetical protein
VASPNEDATDVIFFILNRLAMNQAVYPHSCKSSYTKAPEAFLAFTEVKVVITVVVDESTE